jgi:probable phosphoglycerate mutase
MSRLILVRHGESEGNKARIFADDPHALPLTPLGYEQAREAAELIRRRFNPELVVTSPFVRAHETARIIASGLTLPLSVEPMLYERDVGAYRGRSYDSLKSAADYDSLQPWTWRPKGGESYEDVRARVGPILDRLAHEHPSRDVIVVSHGGVMMTLWAHATGSWSKVHAAPNCGIVLIEHRNGGYLGPQIVMGEEALDLGG